MPNYEFTDLSDYDFECLTRDLLQEELGHRLTTFSRGRDQGVDIRFIAEDGRLDPMVQCKKYDSRAYDRLLRDVRDEVPKVQAMQPKRYMIATTVNLTQARKSAIYQLFSEYMQNPDDVMGRDDICNLLGRHSDVERRHFKLWLGSTAILQRIVSNSIAERSDAVLDRVRERVRLFVPNPALNRAGGILRDKHVCVITGPPGVGKTMLADILLYRYALQGAQAVSISQDMEEGWTAWTPGRAQIFHYDDFLGMARLSESSLNKNEDKRITQFIDRVSRDPLKRFVLTTRDYILNDARLRYPGLQDQDLDLFQCILQLRDYSRLNRARILYNHIYYASLASQVKQSLLVERAYRRIIDHPRYTPRLVYLITTSNDVDTVKPNRFVGYILSRLSDPGLIWRRIFEDQLSDDCRLVLLLMATLPDTPTLDDLELAFRSSTTDVNLSRRFRQALKTLDVTFLKFGQQDGRATAKMADPSLKDFGIQWLSENPWQVRDLVEGAAFFEQCLSVAEMAGVRVRSTQSAKTSPLPRVAIDDAVLAVGLRRTLDVQPLTRPVAQSFTQPRGQALAATRCATLLELAVSQKSMPMYDLFESTYDRVESALRKEGQFVSGALRMVLMAGRLEPLMRSRFAARAAAYRDQLLLVLEGLSEFDYLLSLERRWPELFAEGEVDGLAQRFEALLDDEIDDLLQTADADNLRDAADTVAQCAERMGLELTSTVEYLHERADELDEQEAKDEPDRDDHYDDEDYARDGRGWFESVREEGEIDRMFATLQ